MIKPTRPHHLIMSLSRLATLTLALAGTPIDLSSLTRTADDYVFATPPKQN